MNFFPLDETLKFFRSTLGGKYFSSIRSAEVLNSLVKLTPFNKTWGANRIVKSTASSIVIRAIAAHANHFIENITLNKN